MTPQVFSRISTRSCLPLFCFVRSESSTTSLFLPPTRSIDSVIRVCQQVRADRPSHPSSCCCWAIMIDSLSRVDSLAVRSQLCWQYLSVIVGLRRGPRRPGHPGAGAPRVVRAQLGLGPGPGRPPKTRWRSAELALRVLNQHRLAPGPPSRARRHGCTCRQAQRLCQCPHRANSERRLGICSNGCRTDCRCSGLAGR